MNFNNRNFIRGLVLMAIALLFGLVSQQNYSIGQFSRSGPGLFPLMVSSILFLIGLLSVVRSHFVDPVPLDYSVKNIAIILLSLVGFTVISEYINMLLGIVFLVFCSTFAGTSYSVVRNIKISAGLIAVAFAFKYMLGLSLPLY
ncbi:MAG: tripartite tricarboxylate transporter TctB family protein [Polaromonas sp.]